MSSSLDEVRELELKLLGDGGEIGDIVAEFGLDLLGILGLQWADIGAVVKVDFGLNDLKVVDFGEKGFLLDKSDTHFVLIVSGCLLRSIFELFTLVIIHFIVLLLGLTFLSWLLFSSGLKSFLFFVEF